MPGPAPDVVEAAVNKADKGSSPMKLMFFPLPKRSLSRAGFLYFLFRNITLRRNSFSTGSVFTLTAWARGDAQRLGVSWESVGKTLL